MKLVLAGIIATMGLQITPAIATEIPSSTFIDAATEIDATKRKVLARAVEADPAAIAGHLQSRMGGGKALQRYAVALLAQDQAERLGRQWAILVADRGAWATAEDKDGRCLVSRAKDAGACSRLGYPGMDGTLGGAASKASSPLR